MKISALVRTLCLGAALSTGSLFANTVYISDPTPMPGNTFNGGEFYVQSTDLGNFYTFCLESNVTIGLPGTYDYTVDTMAKNQNDTLSVGSAWLYEKFFKGTLSGPAPASNYSDDAVNNAVLLQRAFWQLEGENSGGFNYYTTLVAAAFGSFANAQANITASSKVQVLNLTKNGVDKQSQLVYVPDTGMTVAVLGLGLLSLAAFRRKL